MDGWYILEGYIILGTFEEKSVPIPVLKDMLWIELRKIDEPRYVIVGHCLHMIDYQK